MSARQIIMRIDLNCDIGESFGRYTLGLDSEILPLISSANIACGFHAGDPVVMRKTVKLAAEHHVEIGAHPGFPDLMGFGRRKMELSPDELRDTVMYQVSALMGFARVYGTRVQHVKPHGAMYNMAANDETMAHTIVDALLELDEHLILVGLSGTRILDIARQSGLTAAREVFADRACQEDGHLVSRQQPGAVITDSTKVAERVVKMVKEQKITAINGVEIDIELDTICVHGDTAGAVEHVRQIAALLKHEGVEIVPLKSRLPYNTSPWHITRHSGIFPPETGR